ncbi:MAG: BON domain-containing protein [Succinivibrio sp.]
MSFKTCASSLSVALLLCASSSLLSGCVTATVATGAAAVGAVIGSDSRTVDVQVDDQLIENEAAKYLSNDRMRSDSKVFRVDCISVNGNVLLVGQTRDTDYLNWAISYIKKIKNVKAIYNYVECIDPVSASVIARDSYITAKVKASLLLGKQISSGRFKVYTENSVVYLLGYVTRDEGRRANNQASKISGIKAIRPIYDYMDQSGTPSSADDVKVVNGAGSLANATNSSSLAEETQGSVDNGGAVLQDDSDLLAPSAPAQSL